MKTKQPVIAVFDIGKTNKKMLVFDERYQLVLEESTNFAEVCDEDGFPCEDIDALNAWILQHVQWLRQSEVFLLKAINFSTYGASLVYLDRNGKRIAPLYNYLKPYPEDLLAQFQARHGHKEKIAAETSSPIMGHLNAGLQVYWFKHCRPELYKELHTVLHFPQYLSYQLTGNIFAEITNVGCHSAIWDFQSKAYHKWLEQEGLHAKLLPVVRGNHATLLRSEGETEIMVGIGLHDSSAAIIPYLLSFKDPFVILSTGTWTISLNPFNKELPKSEELQSGCLSYLTYTGEPVKTSMLFAGNDHDQQVNRIATHFNVPPDYFKSLSYDPGWADASNQTSDPEGPVDGNSRYYSPTDPCAFHLRPLGAFQSAAHAYHQLIRDMINRQASATRMVINKKNLMNIYVDGGFSRNQIFMQLLADSFSGMHVYSTYMTQGTALGAALAIHEKWNKQPLPLSLISLKHWPKSAGMVRAGEII